MRGNTWGEKYPAQDKTYRQRNISLMAYNVEKILLRCMLGEKFKLQMFGEKVLTCIPPKSQIGRPLSS